MAKQNDATKRPSVRPTEDQLRRLKGRAAAAGMSINQYLLACGLDDGYVPSREELELREEAVFQITWAVHELSKINYRLDRKTEVAGEQLQAALDHVSKAADYLGVAFAEKESAGGVT